MSKMGQRIKQLERRYHPETTELVIRWPDSTETSSSGKWLGAPRIVIHVVYEQPPENLLPHLRG